MKIIIGILLGFLILHSAYAGDETILVLTDQEVIALTILQEARGEENVHGMEAVAQVIENRSKERKMSVRFACLEFRQFSCWNVLHDVSYYDALFASKEAKEAWRVAQSVILGIVVDKRVGNFQYYYSDSQPAPYWAIGRPVKKIGHNIFL